MIKKALFIFFGFTAGMLSNVTAQESAVSAGGNASGSTGTVTYSVGQVFYTAVSGSSGSSNMGVQQPYEFFPVGISNYNTIELGYNVFPNPAVANVILTIEGYSNEELSFQLFDLNSRLINEGKIVSPKTAIEMDHLASSTYFIKVTGNGVALKTFKVVKNQ